MRPVVLTLALALPSLAFVPAPFPRAAPSGRPVWRIDLSAFNEAPGRCVVRIAVWAEGQRERRSAFVIVRGGKASAVLIEGERVVHVEGEKPQRELKRYATDVDGLPAAEAVKNLLFHLGACGRAGSGSVELTSLRGLPVGGVEVAFLDSNRVVPVTRIFPRRR